MEGQALVDCSRTRTHIGHQTTTSHGCIRLLRLLANMVIYRTIKHMLTGVQA